MKTAYALIAACALVAGCASMHQDPPSSLPEEGPRGEAYLQGGPTVSLDTNAAHESPTTLELLDTRTRELNAIRAELEAARASEGRAQEAARQAREAADSHLLEQRRLEGLLSEAVAENRDLSERLVSARIEALRLEQNLIRARIAELAVGGDGQ
jgi:hypothetical protein